MKFIDLHQDLVNYFSPKDRRFLGMKKEDFNINGSEFRHADIYQYKKLNTHLVITNLFPLTVTKEGIKAIHPQREIERQLRIYGKILDENEDLYLVRNQRDVKAKGRKIGIILAMEGGEAINNVNDLIKIYSKGVRSMGLTWNYKNQLAGGCSTKYGLTKLGREIIGAMNSLGIILDLVHISPKAFDEALDINKGRVMVSHTALKSIHDHSQNLTDSQVKRIIDQNGMIGISFLRSFYPPNSGIESVIANLRYLKEKFGLDNVAIGTDFFGFRMGSGIKGIQCLSDLAKLVKTLRKEGFTEEEIEKVMYKNAEQFIINSLPK